MANTAEASISSPCEACRYVVFDENNNVVGRHERSASDCRASFAMPGKCLCQTCASFEAVARLHFDHKWLCSVGKPLPLQLSDLPHPVTVGGKTCVTVAELFHVLDGMSKPDRKLKHSHSTITARDKFDNYNALVRAMSKMNPSAEIMDLFVNAYGS